MLFSSKLDTREKMWVLVIVIILGYFLFCGKIEKPKKFPPGPQPLPVFGNLLSVLLKLWKMKYHHSVWKSWSLEYGNLLGLQLGNLKIVIVFGKDLIKEVTSRDVFDGRPDGFMYTLRSFGKKLGIVFSDGDKWSITRRVTLKYLKNFGFGSRQMEEYISVECKELVAKLHNARGPVPAQGLFDVSIINIVWRLVAGKRYELNDERLKYLCNLMSRCFKSVDMSGGIMTFMPFLRHIMPDLIGYTEMIGVHRSLHEFLREEIKKHVLTLDSNKPRDVIDAFLIEMQETKESIFTDEELQVVCLDMFEAGVETVNNTAVFLLLHLVRQRDVQKRLQAEIDDIIGSRPPSLSDRTRMMYTEAVLLETLRISSIAPVGIPHMTMTDAKLGHYTIPKGTLVLLALHDLHNGEHWRNPENFNPERFLTKEGNIIQDEWLMPFGNGKRRCIGERLARSELFLFITFILQKFSLRVPDGENLPDTEPLNGMSLSAKSFSILFEPRTKIYRGQ